MTTRKQIVDEALTWVGTPYHHQGRLKCVGVDCAMILCEVYETVGLIPHVDPTPYPIDFMMHNSDEKYLSWLMKYGSSVTSLTSHDQSHDGPQPGDIALYRFGRCISHAAIVIGWPMVVHAVRGEGVVIGNGESGSLSGRIAGFWRVRGIE